MEVQQLYKDEGVSMFGGCLWSFLPLLILIPLYSVIREPLQYMMHIDADTVAQIKSAVEAALPEGEKLNAYWQYQVAQNIDAYRDLVGSTVQSLNFNFLGIDLGVQPTWKFWLWETFTWSQIGGALIPVISGALSYLSMFIGQKMNSTVIKDDKGEKDEAAAAAQTGKMMTYMMPLMSVFIGFAMPLGMSIYWITQSLFGIIQDYFLTKHYRKIYDAEDAIKREQAALRAAEEAEKERIRAAKRAANPDGIKENTSKKKQQLREKQDREAAAKDFEAKKLAAQGLAPEEAAEYLGGEPNRPYARGRAYQADRYEKGEN